jgi:hypothetical protein
MNAFAEFVYTLVTGFSFSGKDIYVYGALGVEDDVVQADSSAPRNVIDLYYPPLPLRAIDFLSRLASVQSASPQFASQKTKAFTHPKFDPQLFQRKHRHIRTPKHQRVEGSQRFSSQGVSHQGVERTR